MSDTQDNGHQGRGADTDTGSFLRALEETPPQTDDEGGATSTRSEQEGERVKNESQA